MTEVRTVWAVLRGSSGRMDWEEELKNYERDAVRKLLAAQHFADGAQEQSRIAREKVTAAQGALVIAQEQDYGVEPGEARFVHLDGKVWRLSNRLWSGSTYRTYIDPVEVEDLPGLACDDQALKASRDCLELRETE